DDHAVSRNGRIRVALIAGGRSSEHDISLASARSVLEALDPERYEVVQIKIGRDNRWELQGPAPPALEAGSDSPAETLPVPAKDRSPVRALGAVDVVLPILHGPSGEDGSRQGTLEHLDVPYVASGVAAPALCMDKA